MAKTQIYRAAVLSAVKHDYVARGMASHPRFELVVVADDPHVPAWAHERNRQFADKYGIPYVTDVERALRDFTVDVAIVSPEAARHCDLSIRAAMAKKHIVQDKPFALRRDVAERLVDAVERSHVKFLMWNRNFFPAVLHAKEQLDAGALGRVRAIHVDFYFAKDAGPPKGAGPPDAPPLDWYGHQIAAHCDGSDGGLGREPMGELAIEGIYPLAVIQMLTGAAVRRVFARATAHFHQLYADNNIEDLASLTLEMDDGVVASVALGRIGAHSHAGGGDSKIRVLGESGALVVNEAAPAVSIFYRNQPANEVRQRRVANDYDFLLADHFATAIDRDTSTVLDARASLAIFATVEAALESCRSGQATLVRY
jgi:myo-inositol 2-dehydrogenase/D-chiro-inositol 1-dehydrogenase